MSRTQFCLTFKDEPRAGLARLVLLGARGVTALTRLVGAWWLRCSGFEHGRSKDRPMRAAISDSLLRGKRLRIEFVFSGLTLRFERLRSSERILSKRAITSEAKNARPKL